jgi:hypothetical protein
MLELSTVRVLVATPLRGRAYDGFLERGSHGLSFGLSFSQRAKADELFPLRSKSGVLLEHFTSEAVS